MRERDRDVQQLLESQILEEKEWTKRSKTHSEILLSIGIFSSSGIGRIQFATSIVFELREANKGNEKTWVKWHSEISKTRTCQWIHSPSQGLRQLRSILSGRYCIPNIFSPYLSSNIPSILPFPYPTQIDDLRCTSINHQSWVVWHLEKQQLEERIRKSAFDPNRMDFVGMYACSLPLSNISLTSLVHDLDRFTSSLFVDMSTSYLLQKVQTFMIFGVCEMSDLEKRTRRERGRRVGSELNNKAP